MSQIPSHTHDANFRITDSGATYLLNAAHNSVVGANGANITTRVTSGGQAHETQGLSTTLLARVWMLKTKS